MKHFNFACIFTLVLLLFSCGSDDDTEISASNLIGKWKYDTYMEDGKNIPFSQCEQMDFEEYFINDDGDQIVVFTEHVSPDCQIFTSENYSWDLSNNTLVTDRIAFPNGVYKETYTIIELNQTTLQLQYETTSDDVIDPNTGENKKVIAVITYKRE